MQTIYLDISNKGVSPTVYAKQGDVGRKFQVVLTDSGLPYIPVSGSAFSVWYSGASGDGNYTDIGSKSAFTVNENKVIVEMISQMLSNYGDGVLSLALNDPNGNQISTWNIPYFCEPVPGAGSEEAKNYYTAFSQAVENLPYPDASLSVSGKAADAAATGTALAGKAPAGYGLGTTASSAAISDFNNAVQTGWYHGITSTANKPFGYSVVNVINDNGDRHIQICYDISPSASSLHQYGAIAIRRHIDGTWGAWEYVNPPMALGVEYRTTERWNGKAVWTVAVNVGTTAEGAVGTNTDFTASEIIRFGGKIGPYANPQIYDSLSHAYTTWANVQSNDGKINITVWARSGTVNLPAVIQVWYTKD